MRRPWRGTAAIRLRDRVCETLLRSNCREPPSEDRSRELLPSRRVDNLKSVGLTWKATGHVLHDDYVGAQRDAGLAFLRSHRGKVSPITVSLNGNDIVEFLRTCPAGDLACILQAAPAAIEAYRVRLLSILSEIRSISPESEIIVVGAINPDIGAFEFSDPLFQALNEAQCTAAAAVDGRFANPFPVFNPQGDVNRVDRDDLRPHVRLHSGRHSSE